MTGLIIFENGSVQQFGEIYSFAGFIKTIEGMLPALKKQESDRVLGSLTEEQLQAALEAKSKDK